MARRTCVNAVPSKSVGERRKLPGDGHPGDWGTLRAGTGGNRCPLEWGGLGHEGMTNNRLPGSAVIHLQPKGTEIEMRLLHAWDTNKDEHPWSGACVTGSCHGGL